MKSCNGVFGGWLKCCDEPGDMCVRTKPTYVPYGLLRSQFRAERLLEKACKQFFAHFDMPGEEPSAERYGPWA